MVRLRRLRSFALATLVGALVVPGATAGAQDDPEAVDDPVEVVDDMESGLPTGTDADGVTIGWSTFQDPDSTVAIGTTDDPPAPRPDAPADNTVLRLEAEVQAFAGLSRLFANEALDTWTPQDWSGYAGVALWFYGQDSGTAMFLDVLDNRNQDSTTDDAERWTVSFVDDYEGWRLLQWNWDAFARKGVGNNAPDDGFGLEAVHGWALGATTTDGTVTWYADNLQVFGTRPLALSFERPIIEVDENAGEAVVGLELTRVSDEPITVEVGTTASPDRTASEDLIATPERDYVPTTSTLTFAPGETTASFQVPIIDDTKDEVPETAHLHVLDAPEGLDPGPAGRSSLSIIDDDPLDPNLVADFEGEHAPALFDTGGDTTMAVREIDDSDTEGLVEGRWEHVLDVEGAGTVGRDWVFPQDLSNGEGLTFWLEGTGNGAELDFVLKDNRAPDPGPDGWVETWADEFDGPAGAPADPDDWTYETGGWGWGNQELQYYTDATDNAALDGQGHLVITAREVDDPEAADLPCWYGPCTHTSARIITEGKREFGYGRWEARVKVPEGSGIWPAFWSLGNDFRRVGWPQTGEIDVMEFIGRRPNSIFGTIHGPGYSGGESFGSGEFDLGAPVGEDYHEFAVEWQEGLITWFLDGEQYHEAVPDDVAPNEWVFDHPFFLLMNVALGGNFGGPLGDDLDLPQSTYFDWIRVSSAPDTAERFTATITDDTEGWSLVTIPWERFERATEQPDGAPDDGPTLEEAWGWELVLPDDAPRSIDQLRVTEVASDDDDDDDGYADAIETAAGSDPDDAGSVPQCQGQDVTIIGTLEDDRIVGTHGDDVIVAVDGDDRIHAGKGDDVVCGGVGNDRVLGGLGTDALLGEAGDDRLSGGWGLDWLVGGDGDDKADGGLGPDACFAESTWRCEWPRPW